MLAAKIAVVVLYGAAASGLLAVAHRWVLPLSRRAALVLLLLPLALTGRALFTGRAYGPIDAIYGSEPFAAFAGEYGVRGPFNSTLHDVYTQVIPWHEAVRHAWAEGEWPLLDPFLLCGDPLLGSATPAPFYPPNLLALALPVPLALGFLASLHYLIAALGLFLFARQLGAREEAACFGAAGFMTAGFVLFWIEWPLGMTLVYLPWVLAATRGVVRRRGRQPVAVLAGLLTSAMLAGHPESMLHLVALGGLWGLAELAAAPPATRLPAVARALAAGTVALGLTAISTLPVLDTLAQSFELEFRRSRPAHAQAAGSLGELADRALPNLLPFYLGYGVGQVANAPLGINPRASAYTGLLLAPALYGMWGWRRRARFPLAGLLLFGLLSGVRMPGWVAALALVPPFDLALNDRLLVAAACGLAVFAALGLEAWIAAGRGRGLGVALLAGSAALGTLVAALRPGLVARGLTPGFLGRESAWLLVPPLLAGLALAAPRLRPRAAVVLTVLLLGQRLGEMGGFYPTLPVEVYAPRVRPLTFAPPAGRPARTVALGHLLLPNLATHYGIEDPRGYQALHHPRYRALISSWADGSPWDWFQRVDRLDRPMLALLNVRYALLPAGVRPEPPWQPAARGPSVWLWRNPRALERAFLPARVRTGRKPGRILAEMRAAERFDELAWIEPAWIEPVDPAAVPAPREEANGRGTVAIVRQGLGYRLTVDLEDDAWVIVSSVAWRGWRARIAGGENRELPIGIGDYAFLALRAPAGSRTIDLFFRPRSFELGLAITAATAALLLVLALLPSRPADGPADAPLPAPRAGAS